MGVRIYARRYPGETLKSYHHDYTLDTMCKGLITALFPVSSGFSIFLHHARRPMGEKVNGCESCAICQPCHMARFNKASKSDVPILYGYQRCLLTTFLRKARDIFARIILLGDGRLLDLARASPVVGWMMSALGLPGSSLQSEVSIECVEWGGSGDKSQPGHRPARTSARRRSQQENPRGGVTGLAGYLYFWWMATKRHFPTFPRSRGTPRIRDRLANGIALNRKLCCHISSLEVCFRPLLPLADEFLDSLSCAS